MSIFPSGHAYRLTGQTFKRDSQVTDRYLHSIFQYLLNLRADIVMDSYELREFTVREVVQIFYDFSNLVSDKTDVRLDVMHIEQIFAGELLFHISHKFKDFIIG